MMATKTFLALFLAALFSPLALAAGKKGGKVKGSVYEGYWECPDLEDGSLVTAQIVPSFTEEGAYLIRIIDTHFSSCNFPGASRRGLAEAVGRLDDKSGELIGDVLTITCYPGGEVISAPGFPAYSYDPKRDVLTYQDGGMVMCHKLNT